MEGREIVIAPLALLDAQTRYLVRLTGVTDQAGLPAKDPAFEFTTGTFIDTSRPNTPRAG